ncbi:hypothetical protein ACH5RR_030297 [Cinchona calisaya]|uniref:Uncharacterized protein n=1 Tax=Cinchona calisaya TaxID=153742 RepID=A0ABD2YWE1_9GENT
MHFMENEEWNWEDSNISMPETSSWLDEREDDPPALTKVSEWERMIRAKLLLRKDVEMEAMSTPGKETIFGYSDHINLVNRMVELEECSREIKSTQVQMQQTVNGLVKTITELHSSIMHEFHRFGSERYELTYECMNASRKKGKNKADSLRTPMQPSATTIDTCIAIGNYSLGFIMTDDDETSLCVATPGQRSSGGTQRNEKRILNEDLEFVR